VLLIEAGPRLLPVFPEPLSAAAKRALERLGAEVRLGEAVTACDDEGGQPHLRRCPLCVNMIELVVLGNRTTRRECSDLRGHGLHFAPECYLALQQLIARGPIRRTFIGKSHAHGCLPSKRMSEIYGTDPDSQVTWVGRARSPTRLL
jgi:hypothetical protein